MSNRTCSLQGCDHKYLAGGYCATHLKRVRDHGDPGPAEIRAWGRKTCSVDGCERPHSGLGFCDGHRRRFKATGDPGPVEFVMGGWTGDDATYKAVHLRLMYQGKAKLHTCPCGAPADEWAYDHDDPNEKYEDHRGPYSVDLTHYQPMCMPCHRRYDAEYARA